MQKETAPGCQVLIVDAGHNDNGVLGFCHMDRVKDASEGGIEAATVPGVGALLRAHIPKHGARRSVFGVRKA